MKRIVISLLALIACVTMAYAHDGNLLGLKGEVYYVDFTRGYNSFRTQFNAHGALEELYLESPTDHIVLDNITKVNGGFVGSWDGVRVTVSTSGGKITKATYSKDGKACTLTYTYNSAGFLANVRLTKSWTERNTVRNAGSARVNTNGYEKYMKQAQAALKKGNTAAYKKYLNLAQKAANSANVSVRQSTTTTTTTKKSSNESQSYTNYETDKFGNWISRKSGNYTEVQKIKYTEEWGARIDKEKWEKEVLPSGNLDKIERFATCEALSATYRAKAKEEWNRLFKLRYEDNLNSWPQEKRKEYAYKSIINVENCEMVSSNNKVYTSVEQMPQFPGGDAALMRYIASHMQYPAMAQEHGIQGKCIVQFVVTKTGSVGEVKVVRSLSPDCDNEAKRVVRSLPKFTPGKENGQSVNVWYTLPVTFKLQN